MEGMARNVFKGDGHRLLNSSPFRCELLFPKAGWVFPWAGTQFLYFFLLKSEEVFIRALYVVL